MDILELLPHRHPVLLIDKIVSFENELLVTEKHVTFSDYSFSDEISFGYFSEGYIIESFCQSCAILFSLNLNVSLSTVKLLLLSIDCFKFTSQVAPGDILTHFTKMERRLSNAAIFSGYTMNGEFEISKVTGVTAAISDR